LVWSGLGRRLLEGVGLEGRRARYEFGWKRTGIPQLQSHNDNSLEGSGLFSWSFDFHGTSGYVRRHASFAVT